MVPKTAVLKDNILPEQGLISQHSTSIQSAMRVRLTIKTELATAVAEKKAGFGPGFLVLVSALSANA